MADSESVKSVFKTVITENHYVFKWTVENFDKLIENFEVNSPKFRPLKQSIWQATISKTLSDEDGYFTWNTAVKEEKRKASWIAGVPFLSAIPVLLVKFHHTNLHDTGLNLHIEVRDDTNGDLILDETRFHSLSTSATNSIFYLSPYHYGHTYGEIMRKIFRSERVTFTFNMSFITTITNGSSDYGPRSAQNDCLNTLSKDFQNMCDMSLYNDIIVKVKGDRFSAHKAVLSARSAYFKNMFSSNMQEANTNEVELADIEPDVFKCILEYLYTGKLQSLDYGIAHDLYYAAHKYCLFELCQICRDVLMPKLSVHNVEHFISIAQLHNDKDMLEYVIEFLKFNIKDIEITDSVRETLVSELSTVELAHLNKTLLLRKCENNEDDK